MKHCTRFPSFNGPEYSKSVEVGHFFIVLQQAVSDDQRVQCLGQFASWRTAASALKRMRPCVRPAIWKRPKRRSGSNTENRSIR